MRECSWRCVISLSPRLRWRKDESPRLHPQEWKRGRTWPLRPRRLTGPPDPALLGCHVRGRGEAPRLSQLFLEFFFDGGAVSRRRTRVILSAVRIVLVLVVLGKLPVRQPTSP